MDTDLNARGEAVFAPLPQFALLSVTGADARAFLHGQLSNDIEQLAAGLVRRAGYCSPKGRLLASLLVVPQADGFLLQVSGDIAAAIAKRLTMFVLRSKVKIADAGETWKQFGAWGRDAARKLRECGFEIPAHPLQSTAGPDGIVVALEDDRYLVIAQDPVGNSLASRFAQVATEAWSLEEVRAGVPLVTLPTQDQFVPQMANFERVSGVDFKKGCYPGQEIVARTQYLGKLKRRMYRGQVDATTAPAAGMDVYANEPQPIGTVVNAAPRPEGGYEFLAVLQSSSVEEGAPLRLGAADGPLAGILPLPYTV